MSGIALQFLSDVRLRRLMPADGNAKRFGKNVEWIQLFEYELHDKVQPHDPQHPFITLSNILCTCRDS